MKKILFVFDFCDKYDETENPKILGWSWDLIDMADLDLEDDFDDDDLVSALDWHISTTFCYWQGNKKTPTYISTMNIYDRSVVSGDEDLEELAYNSMDDPNLDYVELDNLDK